MTNYIFTHGTLTDQELLEAICKAKPVETIDPAMVNGSLYITTYGLPVAFESGTGIVMGVLYQFKPEEMRYVLKRLDLYETNLVCYVRKKVVVKTEHEKIDAWIYWGRGNMFSSEGLTYINDGDYRRFNRPPY